MILEAVYQNRDNSHSPSPPLISACSERCYREEGVNTVNGLKVEERLRATGLDER